MAEMKGFCVLLVKTIPLDVMSCSLVESSVSEKPTALTFKLGRNGRPARSSETLTLTNYTASHTIILHVTLEATKETRRTTHNHTVHV